MILGFVSVDLVILVFASVDLVMFVFASVDGVVFGFVLDDGALLSGWELAVEDSAGNSWPMLIRLDG